MRIFYFIGFYYIKYFILITVALCFFFVGIDILKFSHQLPDSANLMILFFLYDFIYALGFILPISLLLSAIVVFAVLLRNNEFVALLSLGYSKQQIIQPIFIIASLVLICFIGTNASPLAYAKEKVEQIINKNSNNRSKGELLVKYKNNYVYFERIYPLIQKAEGIRVYTIEGKNLLQFIVASHATFIKNKWQLQDVTLLTFSPGFKLGEQAFSKEVLPTLEILEGFKPKILDIIYERSGSVSIIDALTSLNFLESEEVNLSKIRGILYSLVLFPFFSIPTLALILFKMPYTIRYGEMTPYIFSALLISLMAWGVFFALSRFSMSGFIHPEWVFVLPMCLWFCLGWIFLKKFNN